MKYVSIAILLLQNTSLVLTLRYSRKVKENETPYIASTAVVVTEIVKIASCLAVILRDHNYNLMDSSLLLWREVFRNITETLKVSVPAFLYTIQNNLLYIALTYLDAATFQVSIFVCLSLC